MASEIPCASFAPPSIPREIHFTGGPRCAHCNHPRADHGVSADTLFAKAEAARAESKRLVKESELLERQARALTEQAQRRAEIDSSLFSWQDPTEPEIHLDVFREGDAVVFVGQCSDYEGGPVPLPPEAVQRLIEALTRAVSAPKP